MTTPNEDELLRRSFAYVGDIKLAEYLTGLAEHISPAADVRLRIALGEAIDRLGHRNAANYPPPRVTFSLRTPVGSPRHGPPKWRYTSLSPAIYAEAGHLPTPYHLAPGDLIFLYTKHQDVSGLFRVVRRMWTYPARGSVSYPGGGALGPVDGPLLDIMVERTEGMYVNKVEEESTDAEAVHQD